MGSKSGARPSGAGPSGSDTSKPPASAPPGYGPPRRPPTESSIFSFDGTPYDRKDPNSQTYIRASDARQQQAGVPDGTARPYPSHFGNAEGLPLTTPGFDNGDGYGKQYLHHPLTPGRQDTWAPGTGVPRGGVRSVYTTGNKTDFNVVYHDPKKDTTARGHSQFSMANYHPGVKRAPTF